MAIFLVIGDQVESRKARVLDVVHGFGSSRVNLGHRGTKTQKCPYFGSSGVIEGHRGSSGIQVESRKARVPDVVRGFGSSGVNLGHRGTKNAKMAIFWLIGGHRGSSGVIGDHRESG